MQDTASASISFRFSFEDLRAYQAAEQALILVVDTRDALKGAPGELRSELERSLVSVCLNLAEGAGRKTPGDQGRFYQNAFASAAEGMASLRILRILCRGNSTLTGAEQYLREAGMLTFRLLRSLQR